MEQNKHYHHIGIPQRSKLLRLERFEDHWRVWLQADANFVCGQFLRLYDNGAIMKVTIRADEGDDEMMIKGPDSVKQPNEYCSSSGTAEEDSRDDFFPKDCVRIRSSTRRLELEFRRDNQVQRARADNCCG